jgi:hypothetical protein
MKFPRILLLTPFALIIALCTETTTLRGVSPASAKQLIEQPEKQTEGDPEAWERPRVVDYSFARPSQPSQESRAVKESSPLKVLLTRILLAMRWLRS